MTRRHVTALATIGTLAAVGAAVYVQRTSAPIHAAQAPTAPQTASEVPDSGKERWSQKILRDPDAHLIDFTPKVATVEELTALPAPFTKRPALEDMTRYPAERQVYTVTAQAVGFKAETDEDIHFVIKGDSGATMIVEFPDPSQVAKGIDSSACDEARSACIAKFGQPGRWRNLSGKVTVTGVLFFDVKHGQAGVAKNGVELHPVTAFGGAL